MKINVESITHPRDTLHQVIKKVIPFYIKDYGFEYENYIINRLFNAVYIFDSNPVDTWKFICKHNDEITDRELIFRGYKEYQDYINEERKIDYYNERAFRKFFKKRYDAPKSQFYSLMDLDFDSFSSRSKNILKNGTENEKKNILERQSNYREQCKLAGISAITIPMLVDEIVRYKNDLEEIKKNYLVQNTKWAERIKKEVKEVYNFDISYSALRKCLMSSDMASTGLEEDKNGLRTILSFPIISNVKRGSLDNILYHELRHVVETGNESCGFYKLKNGKYEMINEIHTDKNALLDSNRLSHLTFFGKNRRVRSYYESLFPYLGNLFEDYKMSFDIFAFMNRVDLLERLFGERFLNDLEYKLNNRSELEKGNELRLKRNV